MKRIIARLAVSTMFVGLLSQPAFADSGASIVKEQSKKLAEYGALGDVKNYCNAKSKLKVSIDSKTFSKVVGLSKYEDRVSFPRFFGHRKRGFTLRKGAQHGQEEQTIHRRIQA